LSIISVSFISLSEQGFNDNGSLEASIVNDGLAWYSESSLDDLNTDLLVKVVKLDLVKFSRGIEESATTTFGYSILPTTMPSSMAHLVAWMASVILSLISFISTSEAPPTLITPTPPESLLMRSLIFSLS
jgi:hypothetical protein